MAIVPDKTAPADTETSEELTSDYANNVFFDATAWDLKLVFGEYSQRSGSVDWHTSMTLPWAQAKLMSYYLQINLDLFEIHNGKIRVPDSMVPPDPPPLPSEEQNNPKSIALFKAIQQRHAEFLESLK